MCIRDRHTDLCKAQPVKRIEQEPAALGLGTGVQNSHQLMQRFHPPGAAEYAPLL